MSAPWAILVSLLIASGGTAADTDPSAHHLPDSSPPVANDTAVANFTAAVNRLVTLVGAAGGALLALVWARVAFSWFTNDVAKKIQAKERARDALVGTLLFVAALTGLVWSLAHWVLTGH
ncbi:MAG TPA: hypothetical protein VJS68_02685 [Thermoplasmata archaeon]|nr:hypothetical protein [Thermoplasmata archaeon]